MGFKIYTNKSDSFLEKKQAQVYKPSKGFSDNIFPPFPKTSLIELSNACNHACVFCTNARMERKIDRLDIEIYKKFLDEAISLGIEEIGLYTTGEPFLIKNLDDYVRLAKEAGASYIYITTNGALATPEKLMGVISAGLNSIKFSVNAGTRETYKLIHGKDDFDKVLDHIKFVSDYRKSNNINIKLMTSCVLTKDTEKEEEIIKDILLPHVDEVVFYGVGGQFGQANEQLGSLSSVLTSPYPPLGKSPACSMVWNRIHLSCEGYLTLCCADYENALVYADLNSGTIKEAWHNHVITEMRKRHQSQELDNTLCKNCLYGTNEPHFPLTDIHHSDISIPLSSAKQRGVKSVNKRIVQLVKRRT